MELKYKNLNERAIIAFLLSKKIQKTGKQKGNYTSVIHMRKYRDALVWGAKIAGEQLSDELYTEYDRFIAAYKKEFIKATKEGKTEQNSCDPIPFLVYKLILKWAIQSGNIFVWFWTLSQWNCMARLANINPLMFHNFSVGPDSIVVTYDDTRGSWTDFAGTRSRCQLTIKNHF